jgi:hypothetical protein|uniref:Zinc-ribbon domain protein n=1 Tax=virus sp. ctah610 TaxID=2826807 RepID=A0A8S5R7X1_9VIRU|nr:MAG TPA: zinc-ribbon domain protein [virus sp. ctah610]
MIGKREMQKITITEKEAIKLLNESYIVDYEGNTDRHRINLEKFLISTLEEIHQYREIGTVEECRKSVREDEVLKFYYCESEDDYYIGKRMGNLYYARYGKTGFEWFMSRYLPWGEHVVAPHTLWKENTYPAEPKEIPFFEWLQGFLKKYCGGTVEECREAVGKQNAKKPVCVPKPYNEEVGFNDEWHCPSCGSYIGYFTEGMNEPEQMEYCNECGQHIARDWSEEE